MNKIETGNSATIQKVFGPEEVRYYCEHISGDTNQVHLEEIAAQKMGFETCIVPGIMSSSLFGGLLGTTLPGLGTIHLGQNTRFLKPVYVGEKIKATILVTALREDKPIATLYCSITKENGELALEGEAVVKLPRV